MVAQKLSANRLAASSRGPDTLRGDDIAVRQAVLQRAIYAGLPVVRVGRGSPEGFADPHDYFIAGSNLTSTKARMLLMACLLKLGSLPPAKDPGIRPRKSSHRRGKPSPPIRRFSIRTEPRRKRVAVLSTGCQYRPS